MSTLVDPKKLAQQSVSVPSSNQKDKNPKFTSMGLEGLLANNSDSPEDDMDEEEDVDDSEEYNDEEESDLSMETVYTDTFVVESKYFDNSHIKTISLPKFIMSQGSIGIKEKGFVLITFWGTHKTSSYKQTLLAIKEGMSRFKVKFIDPETKDVLSTWEFTNPYVHAVDFGHVARLRQSPAEFAVEIDYTGINIDGIEV